MEKKLYFGPIQCKYGQNCKYGISCRYQHPKDQLFKKSQKKHEQFSKNQGQIKLQGQNKVINQNQEFISDQQYQQKISELKAWNNQDQYQQHEVCKQKYNEQNYEKGYFRGRGRGRGHCRRKFQQQKYVKGQINQNYQRDWGHRGYRGHRGHGQNQEMGNDHFHHHGHHKHKRHHHSSSHSKSQTSSKSRSSSKNHSSQFESKQKNSKNIKNDKKQHKHRHKKQKWFHKFTSKEQVDPKIYSKYQQSLKYFFQKRNIKPHKKQAIIQLMSRQYPDQIDILDLILPIINQLEKQDYSSNFCYKKLFKTIIKQNFDIQAIKEKLKKKMQIVEKKKYKDQQFLARFPNPVDIEFLESNDLLYNELSNKNTIYLIDGNNSLVTQKHLRFYFQSNQTHMKAEAQLRLRWLLSLVIKDPKRCFLFFDDKFQNQTYDYVAKNILSYQGQYQEIKKSHTVCYPDQQKTADDAIKNKLKQLCQKLSQKQLSNIVLISADRILLQQCYKIHYLRKSSGMYFIKFCRKYLKQIIKKKPFQKHIQKKILCYPSNF